jgi:hypothetical protein
MAGETTSLRKRRAFCLRCGNHDGAWNDPSSASTSPQIAKKRTEADTVELGVGHKFANRHPPLSAFVRRDPLQRQSERCRYRLASQALLDTQLAETPSKLDMQRLAG